MKRWGPALFAQLAAWVVAVYCLGRPGPGLEALPTSVLAALLAATISRMLREPRWRSPMQAAFALAAGLGSQSTLPPWIWAVALAASLLVFGGGLTGRRAPLYLTQQRALAAVLACLPEDLEGQCVDVGAGVGSFILSIAPLRPRLRFSGIERSPLVCLIGNLRCRIQGAGSVRFGDLWQYPLDGVQVLYAFLSPEAMEGLWRKACEEMAPGTLLLVNAFPVPGVDAEQCERYGPGDSECVWRYRLPGPPGPVRAGSTRAMRAAPEPAGTSNPSSSPR